MNDEKLVALETRDHIAVVTLNRIDAMNALSTSLIQALEATAASLRDDDEVWVVVLRSASEKAFCVGADLKERMGMTLQAVQAQRRRLTRAFDEWARLPKPLIAAVNGYALGGGLELALTADVIIMADDAKVGLTEVALGIIPGAGGTQRLPRLVGKMRAKEMILTGRAIDAEEAARIGLASRSVPREQLDDEVMKMAGLMAEKGPLALAAAKRAIDLGSETEISVGLAYEIEAYDVLLKSEDRNEGLLAFNEKRKPVFQRR